MHLRSLFLFFLIHFTVSSTFYAQVENSKQQAEQCIRKGQYQKAIEILESIPSGVRADSINRELNDWLENLYLLQKQWESKKRGVRVGKMIGYPTVQALQA